MVVSRRTTRRVRRHRVHSLRVRAVLAGALVLGVGGAVTLAAWTDQELASAQITAGTFSIVSRTAQAPTFAPHDTAANAVALPLNAANLYPGQSRAAWIQIRNDGTVPGTVALSEIQAPADGTANIALREAIEVGYVPLSAGDISSCTADAISGEVVSGLETMPDLAALPIAAGEIVGYCVVLTLSSEAPNTAQGGVVTPTWTFTGTTG